MTLPPSSRQTNVHGRTCQGLFFGPGERIVVATKFPKQLTTITTDGMDQKKTFIPSVSQMPLASDIQKQIKGVYDLLVSREDQVKYCAMGRSKAGHLAIPRFFHQ